MSVKATPGGTDYQAYYDRNLDITWAADANINGGDTWGNQQAWVAGLAIGGVNGWRLPNADVNDDGHVVVCTVVGVVGCEDNEMGFLYWEEGIKSTVPGPFSNVQSGEYWYGTEVPSSLNLAWNHDFLIGILRGEGEGFHYFAWAVHDGDVGTAGVLPLEGRLYSIPPEAFVSESGNPVRTSWGSGGAYHTEACFDAMVAPVNLPDGAIITRFTMYFVDNDKSDLTMWLQSRSHVGTAMSIISRVDSSGVSGDDHTVHSLSQIASHEVNNESNNYAVRVAADWPGTPALRINAALLEYVISEAP